MSIKVDMVVDAKGLSCPMPIVRSKKAIDQMHTGQVLEVQATDKGSLADIKAWSKSTGNDYLGSKEEGDVLLHYIRKCPPDAEKPDVNYPHQISQDELKEKLGAQGITILDVREPAEYAFGRIPGTISLPLGKVENRLNEFGKDDEIYVICRTDTRSDMASKLLSENGFTNVKKVVPGMSEWNGQIEKDV
jgi:rhodanese-related sulfurtransferase/TusA-related sulfurtransferase